MVNYVLVLVRVVTMRLSEGNKCERRKQLIEGRRESESERAERAERAVATEVEQRAGKGDETQTDGDTAGTCRAQLDLGHGDSL